LPKFRGLTSRAWGSQLGLIWDHVHGVQIMKTTSKSVFVAGIALALMMSGASAQMMGGGHKRQANTTKSDTQKPKADEKAYAQAIGSLPDKSYDPWHSLR
jgi:hypothetical protein